MKQVEHATDFGLQPEIGFSNSDAVKDAPPDVIPEVPDPEPLDPGFTNKKAVKSTEAKVLEESTVEDKSTKPRKAASKRS